MQRCLQCGVHFEYWPVMRSGMFGYKPIQCQACNTSHKVTSFTPFVISIVVVAIPMIAIQLIREFVYKHHSFIEFTLIYVLLILPMLLILPYVMRYEKVPNSDAEKN